MEFPNIQSTRGALQTIWFCRGNGLGPAEVSRRKYLGRIPWRRQKQGRRCGDCGWRRCCLQDWDARRPPTARKRSLTICPCWLRIRPSQWRRTISTIITILSCGTWPNRFRAAKNPLICNTTRKADPFMSAQVRVIPPWAPS